MIQASVELKRGDLVEVLSANEILETLDEDGSLDGLPFMPEMIEHCGRRYRIFRQAFKSCVECSTGRIDTREFYRNDVWVLDELRCSGVDHDGCHRGCLLYWKTPWLRKVTEDSPKAATDEQKGKLQARLKTKVGEDQYVCQSTRLEYATQKFSHWRRLKMCYRDVCSGAVRASNMISMILCPIWKKYAPRILNRLCVGQQAKTPTDNLDLQPGELVEVKSLKEIRETLDRKGCNRGLRFDKELKGSCGRTFRVRSRLDRMIMEKTGVMRKVNNSVILEDSICPCSFAVGGCPRKEFVFWREIWLRRVEEKSKGATPTDS